VPLLRGRSFGAQDVRGADPVAVVNETLARRYFGAADPVGRRVRVGGAGSEWRTVVGVSRDVLNARPGEPANPHVYLPLRQVPTRTLTFLIRTPLVDPVVAVARQEVAAVDPEQPLYDVKTMERAFYEDLASNRVITGLFVTFAVVALALATVGLYGLISYTVSQRTRELGLRVALGASRGAILQMVLGQGLRLAAVGLALGLLFGAGLARVTASAFVGVSATDPATFTLVPLTLGIIAVLASGLPALRAARSDPAVVLRSE
jgi:hypothetical protein